MGIALSGLGAAHLEIVGDPACQAVQRGVARQAEDVVDAVLFAPGHGLGPSVVAVAPDGEPGARPVPADAADQVLDKGAELGARRRLAGAQENRHRPATLDMVDVDGQGAPCVVVGVEQRQLLAAVHRIAGVVDVERDRRRRGSAAGDVDQGGRHARSLRCARARSPAGSWSAGNTARGRSAAPGRRPA